MPLARRDEVRDRRLEGAGSGGAEQEDVVLGPADLAQASEHALVDRQEVRAAVVDHRRADRGQHLGRYRRRSRREQVPLRRHVTSVAIYAAGHGHARRVRRGIAGPPACRPAGGAIPGERRPELLAWAAGLGAYAVAPRRSRGARPRGGTSALSASTTRRARLLTAPLLGAGSLLLAGRRRAAPVVLVYAGLAVGIALAVPVHGTFAAHGIPAAQDHLAFIPARVLAIVANIVGTLAVVVVAVRSFRRRPLGNGLIIAGIAAAATGAGSPGSVPRGAQSASRSARRCFTQDSSLLRTFGRLFAPK